MMGHVKGLTQKVATLQKNSGNKYVIYTCVTNGYSEVMPAPPALRNTFDFILFCDEQCLIDGWTCLLFDSFHADPRRSAKFSKILPHTLLSAYESSIWVDGNFQLRPALNDLFLTFLYAEEVLLLFRHRRRNCIYAEALECLRWGKDAPKVINDQMLEYKRVGHPEGWGLFMGGFLMRKHNSSKCVKLMQDWWNEIEAHSVRDQLSLPVVLRRHEIVISTQPFELVNTYFEILPHLKYRSYTLSGLNLINPRALIAPLIYNITVSLKQLRKKLKIR
jgi:hypothetical protein